jgi:hypothetical protein
MQTHGLKRFLVAPVAALAVGATLLLTPHSAFADQRDFTLVNRSSQTIRNVYVSASDHRSWEEDVLGSDVLLSGRRLNIRFSGGGGCIYDLRIVTMSGSEATRYGMNLCTTTTVTYE